MRIGINATSAKMGGAATYLHNLLPELARQLASEPDSSIVVWSGEGLADSQQPGGVVQARPHPAAAGGGLKRLFFDQVELPRALRREGCDALFSSASIGPLRPPCPQVVLVRNPIYFSKQYERRMTSRWVRLHLRAQRWLTLQTVRRADHVLFPTKAMLEMVAAYTGGPRPNWSVAPYGIRHDLFAPPAGGQDTQRSGPVRLLHVSHYCDQKDVGALLRAVALLDLRHPGRCSLTLTAGLAGLRRQANPHCPTLDKDRRLLNALAKRGAVTDLGPLSHASLPEHYRRADLFVFPSYTESFGHPLVEAMASGLPVVAADVPVNREMCGDAADYFPAFDAQALAGRIEALAGDADRRSDLRQRGLARAARFRWQRHAGQLLQVMGHTPAVALPAAA